MTFKGGTFIQGWKKGFSIPEVLIAVAIMSSLAAVFAGMIKQFNGPNKQRFREASGCQTLVDDAMTRLQRVGMLARPLEYANTSRNIKRNDRVTRTVEPGEENNFINPAHRFPNSSAYDIIDKNVYPRGIRNALLNTGVMAHLMAIYNSDPRYCISSRGLAYDSGLAPLVSGSENGSNWRGVAEESSNQEIDVSMGMRIQPYDLNTGTVQNCNNSPLIVRPRGDNNFNACEPGTGQIVQDGSGVTADVGFLVTIYASYQDTDGQNHTCQRQERFQYPTKRTRPNTPAGVIVPSSGNESPMTCSSTSASHSFRVEIGYTKNAASAGSVIFCRDRSVRLRPIELGPASETIERGITDTGQSIERCVSAAGVTGGLSVNNPGEVDHCFVRRKTPVNASDVPWDGENERSGSNDTYYMPSDTTGINISRIRPVNEWVPCEEIEVCAVNGNGTRPDPDTISIRDTGSTITYAMTFNLNEDQSGCDIHIDTMAIDDACNRSDMGSFSRSAMNTGSPSQTDGYCVDPAAPNDSSRWFANCQTPVGDGKCFCGLDREWDGTDCVDVAIGRYSPDGDNQGYDCNPPPANEQWIGTGNGTPNCPTDCVPGYRRDAGVCVPDVAYHWHELNNWGICTGSGSGAGTETQTVQCHDPDHNIATNTSLCTTSMPSDKRLCNCGVDRCFGGSGTCVAAGNGRYSTASSNICRNCTNAPANAIYTSDGNGSRNGCRWRCDTANGYNLNPANNRCERTLTPTATPPPPPPPPTGPQPSDLVRMYCYETVKRSKCKEWSGKGPKGYTCAKSGGLVVKGPVCNVKNNVARYCRYKDLGKAYKCKGTLKKRKPGCVCSGPVLKDTGFWRCTTSFDPRAGLGGGNQPTISYKTGDLCTGIGREVSGQAPPPSGGGRFSPVERIFEEMGSTVTCKCQAP